MKVLVVAPHPDDETIGAGGALFRHIAQGDDVFWCVVTQNYPPNWSEDKRKRSLEQIAEVQKIYGFQAVFRLGFPTVKLNTVPHIDLCTALQDVVHQCKPDIVYTSSRNDPNLDHRIVHDCTLVAVRPLPGNSVRRVLCYEIGYTQYFGLHSGASAFQPNVFVDITPYIEQKLAVMDCFKTQLCQAPHPRTVEGIRLLSRSRGLSVCCEYAECFELVRELL